MSDEDWMKAAMTDDSVVVELLMRLHRAAAPAKTESSPALPLDWTVRQRRSKPMLQAKKKPPTPSVSPTTPLSWSGATSISGGGCTADGFEESSRPPSKRPEATGSKVIAANGTTTNRRSRKKKTLVELKEEEILLLKERRHLKRELATLHVTLEKQRATNECLKRYKLDLEFQPPGEVRAVASTEAMPDQTQQNLASHDSIPPYLQPDVGVDDHDRTLSPSQTGSSKMQKETVYQDNKFLLPDLNLPIKDSDPNVIDTLS